MSTSSLPSYRALDHSRIPTYSAEPSAYERRLAVNRSRLRPSGEFVKQSKGGGVSIRLTAQENNVSLPVYGCGSSIEGTVELPRTDGVAAVEVKIEGTLRLKEIAEGGTVTHKLCSSRASLWDADRASVPCPTSLRFSLGLPATFTDGKDTYPLPPTHEVHLSGVPGFRATIDYAISAYVYKGKAAALLPVKQNNTVSTPFVYYPRSRPALGLPGPMTITTVYPGVLESADWTCFDTVMAAKSRGVKDIVAKLYIPASRVFCLSEPIPFHLTFASSAVSLAAFLPYVLRQSSVDVRNTTIAGTKTDIWRVLSIGEGSFRHACDGQEFMSFVGEIAVNPNTRIGGFKAGGLFIKDCIVLSMIPPDPTKSPFSELRCVVPIRLTTDPWSSDNTGAPFLQTEYSTPSTPEESHAGSHFSDYQEQV
ncbi:unnamed protein product [Somion occarium]|uniref:Arrestin-like N-terminal domain-containing protein n=1 Tax=Somion occarium TaxID=3059160 RepID=A0ABP1DX78_9APHY